MKATIIAESYSSKVRIETAARRHGSLNYIIEEDGQVTQVAAPNSADAITVMLVKGKNGERIFTPWEMSYVVPPRVQLEALWGLLLSLKVPLTFCGFNEVAQTFRWGWMETLQGVSGRARMLVGQGGVLPEFYCLARFRGMSAEEARALAVQHAREGAAMTAMPSEATSVQAQNARPTQRNGDQRQFGGRASR